MSVSASLFHLSILVWQQSVEVEAELFSHEAYGAQQQQINTLSLREDQCRVPPTEDVNHEPIENFEFWDGRPVM